MSINFDIYIRKILSPKWSLAIPYFVNIFSDISTYLRFFFIYHTNNFIPQKSFVDYSLICICIENSPRVSNHMAIRKFVEIICPANYICLSESIILTASWDVAPFSSNCPLDPSIYSTKSDYNPTVSMTIDIFIFTNSIFQTVFNLNNSV